MRRRPLLLLCVGFMLVLVLLNLAGISAMPRSRDLARARAYLGEEERTVAAEGIVDSCEQREEYGILILRECSLLPEEEREPERLAVGRVRILYDGEQRYPCGCVLRARGEGSLLPRPENPGAFDSRSYYQVKGIHIQIRKAALSTLQSRTDPIRETMALLRERAGAAIRASFPGDVSGILCAMLIGDRSGIDEETRTLWQTGGIMHMLAISGLHLSLLGMGLFTVLRRLCLPLLPSGLLVTALVLAYTVFVGSPVSAVRACAMLILMMAAQLTGRTYDPLTALAAAALLVLLANPEYLFYSGFQLSVSAVVLCSLFSGRSGFMTGVFLYLWMLPLVASSYYEIPLLSVFVNLAAVPLLPVLLAFGMAGTALHPLAASPSYLSGAAGAAGALLPSLAAAPAVALLRIVNTLLSHLEGLPFSRLITGKPGALRCALYVAALFLWTWLYDRYRLFQRRFLLFFLLPVLIGILSFRLPGGLKLTFLSVGQGDGICIQTPSGVNVLVDCGSSTAARVGSRTLVPFLKHQGIRELAYVMATHGDEDHISGIREMLELKASGCLGIGIGALVLPALAEEDARCGELEAAARAAGVRVLHVRRGDTFRAGEVRIDVLGPAAGLEEEDANSGCLVCGLHYGDFDALLTGDVTGAGEELLTEGLREMGDRSRFEVLKVAHHGSSGSTPEELLELVSPAVSILSCGKRNRYGHPHKELLDRLEAAGTRVYRTDQSGAVTVRTDGRSWSVETYLPAAI